MKTRGTSGPAHTVLSMKRVWRPSTCVGAALCASISILGVSLQAEDGILRAGRSSESVLEPRT